MHLASLVDFLNTGQLGPLKPGMTLNQIADELEPPDWWNIDPGFGPAPHYWGYGDHLEVFFDFAGEPHCQWFQIEHASALSGQAIRICDNLSLVLDGIWKDTRIPSFIKAFTNIDDVEIDTRITDDGFMFFSLYSGVIEIIFDCGSNKIDRKADLQDRISFCEENAVLDSIYSYFKEDYRLGIPPFARAARSTDAEHISAKTYLDLAGSLG